MITANKVADVKACWIDEKFFALQGVEDDDLSMIRLDRLLVGYAATYELV
jgi:hypothetical protein